MIISGSDLRSADLRTGWAISEGPENVGPAEQIAISDAPVGLFGMPRDAPGGLFGMPRDGQ